MPLPHNTRDDIFKKLLHDIREAQEGCNKIGHLHAMQDSEMELLLAKGWHGIAEVFDQVYQQVLQLGMKRMQ